MSRKFEVIGLVFLLAVVGATFTYQKVQAAGEAISVADSLVSAIEVGKVTDLHFSDDTEKATAILDLRGEPNRAFNLLLPPDGIVAMRSQSDSTAPIIPVNGFSADIETGVGVVNSSGARTVKVGAVRAAVPAQRAPASYNGNFSITVVY